MNQQNILIYKVCLVFLAILANTQQLYNHDVTSYRNQTWMSTLDYGLPIREMSILGTHNSLGFQNCFWLGSFQQCQSNPLQIQLQSGVRALDIRVKHKNNKFQLYDRDCDLEVNFDQVLTTVKAFLNSYPSQTVLLHLVQQQDPSGSSRSFEDTFKSYRDNYSGLFWTPTTQDPLLGDVRGQIVLIQEFSALQIHGLLYATFTTLANKKFSTNWDLYDKWQDVKSFLNSANSAKKSRISFWTGHGGSYPYFVASGKSDPRNSANRLLTGMTTPGWRNCCRDFPRVGCFIGICSIVFEGINILGYQHINDQNIKYTGIVYVDFYGNDLLKKIMSRNTVIYGKCTSTQTSQGCILCNLAGQCLKCNTKMHYIYHSPTKSCLAQIGYYLNASYIPQLCSSAIPGCLECTDSITCTSCDNFGHYLLQSNDCIAAPGYYLNNSFIPTECPQIGCEQCLDEIVCIVCSEQTNYIIDDLTNSTCKCDDTAHFVQASTTIACICQPGYYLSPNTTCEDMPKCPDMSGGCLNCDNSTNICLQCDISNHFVMDPSNTYCLCDSLYYFTGSGCSLCNVVDAACDQCANENLCLSCVDNFTLVRGVCECSFQYYMVDNDTCHHCTVGCLVCSGEGACTACDTANNFTLVGGYCECKRGMFEQNGSCVVCGAMAGCIDCNNDGCTECEPIFGFSLDNATSTCVCDYGFFINDMRICEKCMMEGCLHCSDQDHCIDCNSSLYYLNASDVCDDICGDGFQFFVECDDGNFINGDGCSDTCKIQPDYTCVGGSRSSKSVCSYSGPVYLTLQKTLKDVKTNKVYINLRIKPVILAFETMDFGSVINPLFPFQSKNVSFNTTSGQILLIFTYNQSLNSKTSNDLQVSFQPPTGQPQYYYMKAASANLPQVTNNNLALKYYDEGVYQLLDIMTTLTKVTAFMYIGIFLICFLFISKLIAIQLVLVPQVAFAGLIMIEKLESLLLPLNNMFPVNGYNPLFDDNIDLPPRIQVLLYGGEFLTNFNIDLAIICVPLIVGSTLFLIGKNSDNKKLRIWSYKSLKQWTLSVLLVFQFQFTIAIGIEILYSQNMIGKAIGGVLFLSFVALMILFYRRPLNFGQFKKQFVQQPKHLYYYIGVVLFRFVLAANLIFMSQSNACGFVAIGIIVVNIVYIVIFRPYLKNIRPVINYIVMAAILAIQSYYKLNFYSSEADFITNYLPITIIVLLLVLLIINLIFMILQVKQNHRKDQISKYQKHQDESFDIQMRKQLNKQMEVIVQIQMALSPSNLNKVSEKDNKNTPNTERELLVGLSQLKQIQKNLNKQKNIESLNQNDQKVYDQI